MAASMLDEDELMPKSLLSFIRNESTNALHISRSESRSLAHQKICESMEIVSFLEKFLNVLQNEMKSQNAQVPFSLAFAYFQSLKDIRKEFISLYRTVGLESDLNELFNFYSSCTFEHANKLKQTSVSPANKCTLSERQELFKETSYQAESDSALYRLGGGTLGQIWKVSKRNKHRLSASVKQRSRYKGLYLTCLLLRMTSEDKLIHLSEDLISRDKGGMFFPKKEFLPLIRELNDCVRSFASPAAFKKYGKEMIKKCVSHVKEEVALVAEFQETVKLLVSGRVSDTLELFVKVWIRKMVHARIQEFVGHYAEKVKKIKKGGQTLRDKLYSVRNLSHKNRRTVCQKRQMKIKKLGNGSLSRHDMNKTGNKKCKIMKKKNNMPLTSSLRHVSKVNISSSDTSPHRPVRNKRVARRLMHDDFVYV